MTKVVNIKFRAGGRSYYFSPGDLNIHINDHVLVETANGISYGYASSGVKDVEDDSVVAPLKPILRIATKNDEQKIAELTTMEKEAYTFCYEKIHELKLEMNLVSVESTFDGAKITFFFTADERVDFRELVKILASKYHTRIELHQMGVRDKARMMGGLGICGRPFCCNGVISNMQPVTLKMAKEQGLPINPVNISGTCGRLLCCLAYEQKTYEQLYSEYPKTGDTIKTPDGIGIITDVKPISDKITVKLKDDEGLPHKYKLKDLKRIK